MKKQLTDDQNTLETYRKNQEKYALFQVKINQIHDHDKKITETCAYNERQCAQYDKELVVRQTQCTTLTSELKELAKNTSILLKKNVSYSTLTQKLEQLIQQFTTAPYNAQEHQDIQKQLEKIEKTIAQYAAIQKEITQQDERKKAINKLEALIQKITTEKQDITKQIDTYKQLPEQEQKTQEKQALLDQHYAQLKKEKNTLLEEKGSLTSKTHMLERIEKEYYQHKKISLLSQKTKNDYQAIALATGKDGIQALLIEEAIPEIEQEANELLSQLTNNQ